MGLTGESATRHFSTHSNPQDSGNRPERPAMPPLSLPQPSRLPLAKSAPASPVQPKSARLNPHLEDRMLRITLHINTNKIADYEVRRVTNTDGPIDDDDVSLYEIRGIPDGVLCGRIVHTYGRGAEVLAAQAMVEVTRADLPKILPQRPSLEHVCSTCHGFGHECQPLKDCHCRECKRPDNGRMVLCDTCGNKRCPHAASHRSFCSGNNNPVQTGFRL